MVFALFLVSSQGFKCLALCFGAASGAACGVAASPGVAENWAWSEGGTGFAAGAAAWPGIGGSDLSEEAAEDPGFGKGGRELAEFTEGEPWAGKGGKFEEEAAEGLAEMTWSPGKGGRAWVPMAVLSAGAV
jgi:hypothetical protein